MNRTLLFVDDEPSVRRGLRAVFESVHFHVVEAANTEEAEEALCSHNFSVVLLDLSLGGAHGLEGLDLITRARQRGVSAPIVIFTSFGNEAVRSEALARGAADLWSKGIPIEELVRRVLVLDGLSNTPETMPP